MLSLMGQVMWVWGPVTQFALDLKGIDSSGKGSCDIMELIARNGARQRIPARPQSLVFTACLSSN